MKKHFGHRLIKKRQSRYHISLPRMGKGDLISGARVLSLAAQMRLSFPVLPAVFHTIVTLSAPTGHLPLKGKAAIRDYHPLKKGGEAALVNPSAPQVPSSRAQPRDLYCAAAICTHAPSLQRHLGASFFAFHSPTVYRSAGRIPPLRSGWCLRETDSLT